MARLWHLGGLTWLGLLKRLWHEMQDDDVFGQAAELSYYFLLALFPFLLFLTTLFGYFAQGGELRADLLDYFRRVVPRSAFRLIVGTLNEITSGAGGGKLSIGILGALWAASSGVAAIADGLNTAYDIKEERPWWKVRLIAIGLTIAFVIFTGIALGLVLAGAKIGALLAGGLGLAGAFAVAWNILRWPIALSIVLTALNLLYRFAPDLKDWKWRWMTPGALVAILLWVLASLGFRFYLRFFNTYGATYGSLGALIILMLWFYITSTAILVGAEVNSIVENAAAEAGEPDARRAGERRPGEQAA
jgi:membrane protein